jgi:cytochrome b subunit of formate dehydrogenase
MPPQRNHKLSQRMAPSLYTLSVTRSAGLLCDIVLQDLHSTGHRRDAAFRGIGYRATHYSESPFERRPPLTESTPRYRRFGLGQRLEHILALVSFTVLALTGLPQMFTDQGWAQALISFYGGIVVTRDIHHLAAIIMMLTVVDHLVGVGYRVYVRRARPTIVPGLQDVRDAAGTLLYNLGFNKKKPLSGRYTFEEKVEYWAFVWGILIMGVTGFMMWNPITTAKILPGVFIAAANAVHGYEAVLAVLAILVWHLYGVHLRHFNKSMWTGQLTENEMREEHQLELAEIQSGITANPVDGSEEKKRLRIYVPIASVLTAVLVFGVYKFATFEKTTVSLSPRLVNEAQLQAFLPLTPTPFPYPSPTPIPIDLKPLWQDNVALILAQNCSVCHGGIAGLDLSTYPSTLKGGIDGPVIQPGDPANSLILQKISTGKHPGKLTDLQLSILKAWIAAGAPEK